MNLKHDKEKILQSGEALFRAKGYHATGINEVLKSSGVSKGSFYNYFDSKEDFALQVVDLYGNATADIIQYYFINSHRTTPSRTYSHIPIRTYL